MVSANPVENIQNELVKQIGEHIRHGQNADSEVETTQAVKDSKFIGVYFGAHWAPPCRKFTTSLQKNYEEANKDGKKLEVIFCSSDGSKEAFERNFNEMGWYAINYSDASRKQSLS